MRASPGRASIKPSSRDRPSGAGWRASFTMFSYPEDREMDEACPEAEHGAVRVQHPLILADRRAQELHEVGVGHLAHPRLEQRPDARALLLGELRVGERRHRVLDRSEE